MNCSLKSLKIAIVPLVLGSFMGLLVYPDSANAQTKYNCRVPGKTAAQSTPAEMLLHWYSGDVDEYVQILNGAKQSQYHRKFYIHDSKMLQSYYCYQYALGRGETIPEFTRDPQSGEKINNPEYGQFWATYDRVHEANVIVAKQAVHDQCMIAHGTDPSELNDGFASLARYGCAAEVKPKTGETTQITLAAKKHSNDRRISDGQVNTKKSTSTDHFYDHFDPAALARALGVF